jgi:D-alanine-D-alanine ligase
MRVVVLMGGTSSERNVSLATGRGVAQALTESGHEVIAVDPADGSRLELASMAAGEIGERPAEGRAVARSGGPAPIPLAKSRDLLAGDVVFIALHGGAGEDGTLQALLDLAGVRYTGSGMLASALAMDKARAKVMLGAVGVPTPPGVLLPEPGPDPEVAALGGYPVVVKPNAQGSSVGVHIVERAEDLAAALADAFQYGPVLVERFIPGREVTVAVLDGEALPVVEIVPEAGFYDYRHKYTKGHTRYEVPARLDAAIAERLSRLGETAFEALGCAGVARVDFRLDPEGNPFCLEVNTVPGMTETSLVPMAAREAGISYRELVRRLVELARVRRP